MEVKGLKKQFEPSTVLPLPVALQGQLAVQPCPEHAPVSQREHRQMFSLETMNEKKLSGS